MGPYGWGAITSPGNLPQFFPIRKNASQSLKLFPNREPNVYSSSIVSWAVTAGGSFSRRSKRARVRVGLRCVSAAQTKAV